MTTQNTSETLVSMFLDRVAKTPRKIALHVWRDGGFQAITWQDLAVDVARTAAALRQLGVEPGDRVVQVSENRYEWIVSDLAILMAQAVHVPVHTSLSAEQIAFQIGDCDPKVVLFCGREQGNKIVEFARKLPAGVQLFSYDKCPINFRRRKVKRLADVVQQVCETDALAIEREALVRLKPHDLASLLYTSGTTGECKGVMLSHRNLVFNTRAMLEPFELFPDDLRLCFLPLSHVFARTCDMYTWIASGCELALAENFKTILANCAQIKPTTLNGVPYFFDRIYRHLTKSGTDVEPGRLKELFGGRARGCCTGGAAISQKVVEFFESQDVPLLQGYGLTETSPVISVSSETAYKVGSVGRPLQGVELKLAEDGEILTRGPHVMKGYWRNSEATHQAIRDGWFHTGDLGRIDSEGLLYITGRKKEIIVTACGKNVSPSHIENLLKEDPLILQAMVIGDGKNYLTALIVPDPDVLRATIKSLRIWVWTKAGAVSHRKVLALYEERIKERLKGVSYYEQIRRFKLLDRGFTIESGELTPTLKLKRNVALVHFADAINSLYIDAAKTA